MPGRAIDVDRGATILMSDKQKVKKIPCEVYSRIVGYLRPVQNWNDGKRQEFKDRQVYEWKGER